MNKETISLCRKKISVGQRYFLLKIGMWMSLKNALNKT